MEKAHRTLCRPRSMLQHTPTWLRPEASTTLRVTSSHTTCGQEGIFCMDGAVFLICAKGLKLMKADWAD
jgi:hypothetical protein